LDRRGAVIGGPEAPFTLRTVPYVDAFCMHECGRKASPYVDVSRHTSTQDTANAKIICYLLRRRRNATTDGNATYDDAVYVIAAVEIDYNVAVLV